MSSSIDLKPIVAFASTLSPQQQESLRLLQAPIDTLLAIVNREIDENPALIAEYSQNDPARTIGSRYHRAQFSAEYYRQSQMLPENSGVSVSISEFDEFQLGEKCEQSALSAPRNLATYLIEQLCCCGFTKFERAVAECIIGSLDDNGYLDSDLKEICALTGADMPRVLAVLDSVQQLAPVGVAARDLRESLLLQLTHAGREGSLEYRIVAEHLSLLQTLNGRTTVAYNMGRPFAQVQQAIQRLRALSARPGALFTKAETVFPTVDIRVVKTQGRYIVQVINSNLPNVTLNRNFRQNSITRRLAPELRQYFVARLRAARQFIFALRRRQETLLKVAEAIVRRQNGFLEFGPAGLTPLSLEEIATEVELDDSTVSRAISGKFIETPRGVLEMRSFLTQAVGNSTGESPTRKQVAAIMLDLIKRENHEHPLEDQDLVQELLKLDIILPRRTVAYFRSQLGIGSARFRRLTNLGVK